MELKVHKLENFFFLFSRSLSMAAHVQTQNVHHEIDKGKPVKAQRPVEDRAIRTPMPLRSVL